MIKTNVIQQGRIEMTPDECVKECSPTSSLLELEDFKVVIDTMHPKEDKRKYIHAMLRLSASPVDVDVVIFTHLHPDHFGHKELFPNSVFVFHRDEKFGPLWFKEDDKVVLTGNALFNLGYQSAFSPEYIDYEPDLKNLENKIYIRHIPGHTPGSVAVFASINSAVHCWVGDTFLDEAYFNRRETPHCSWEEDRIYEHMDYIETHADVIVPGHGSAFRIER
ncbi:MAG: MBL fold metallo-hydrolase [Proteobacteria bacterium]|nr:MBL fold metallo-hydrolase [Pseudomonadota bacterium]